MDALLREGRDGGGERLTPLDPETCPIQGDLSRRDVIELVRLCRGKRVVEFGMGGSTLILGRVARSLASYETSDVWYHRTVRRYAQMKERVGACELRPFLIAGPCPESIEECDVLFLDGKNEWRASWLQNLARFAPVVVVHDARRQSDVVAAMAALLGYLPYIEDVEFSPGGSNLLIAWLRKNPLHYEDWNATEAADRRVSAHCEDYVSEFDLQNGD